MPERRHVVVYRRADGLWEWRLLAGNGEIVTSTDQGFTKQSDAIEAAAREFPDYPIGTDE